MKRGAALIALTLVLGACGSSRASKGPATHAVVSGGPGGVEVWRDAQGRLTFHHIGDHSGDIDRWNPRTHTMESFVDGSLDDSESGLLNAEAWRDINAWYGVDESQVESALASGKRSPEPVDFNVSSPKLSPCAGPRFTDYGTSVGKMAAATGLVLPRLTKLRGQRLSGLSGASGCVDAMSFGPSSTSGVPSTSVDVAARRPGDPDALVNTYKSMFASMPHRHAPVEYAAQASSIYFPYRSGEWVWIETSRSFTPNEAKHLVRAILSAPTAG